jgi:hypothetical protein
MLSKKSKAGDITIPDFKLCYKTMAIKIACYWHKNQWNSVEDTEHSCNLLIFDKGLPNIPWRKDGLFDKWCSENWDICIRRQK